MEESGQVTKKARKKKRKSSPRPTRYRGRLKRPGTAEAQRKLWADPEWRAQMTKKRQEQAKRRKAEGSVGRYGVPDGMRKAQADQLNQAASESAKETMSELKQTGVLDGLDPRSEQALETAVKIMRAPGDKKVKLAAARLVLDFTKSKPASKSDITVNKAEEWLAAVAAQNDGDKGETSPDA